MYFREVKNRSGSVSVHIFTKKGQKYKFLKSVGTGKTPQEIETLRVKARNEIERIKGRVSLFPSTQDSAVEGFLDTLDNSAISLSGPELIFGRLYEKIGFAKVKPEVFRDLVIGRLYAPASKLKTLEYLRRYLGREPQKHALYEFIDGIDSQIKELVEKIAFEYAKKVLGTRFKVVFFDATTLHFEAPTQDDLRKTGFSKAGKHHRPQILLALLTGPGGWPLGYEMFPGNRYEGSTLLEVLYKFKNRFDVKRPVVVADSGMLSKANRRLLIKEGYGYIIGGRIKNLHQKLKDKIISKDWAGGVSRNFKLKQGDRLVVSYAENRAKKDRHNRERGLKRLEKNVGSGNITKSALTKRGYNRYLFIKGDAKVGIDYEAFEKDGAWDGLKGYVTNTKLSKNDVIAAYSELWHIERAFRMSKTDLEIRPIYHRLENRINGHICVCFAAYTVLKELERILKKEKSKISLKRASELTHSMYTIEVTLPESKKTKKINLKPDAEQAEILFIADKYC